MGIEGRAVRRGTARGILAALENILSTTMGSRARFGGKEGSGCGRGISCREMGQVRELFSLNIVGKQLIPFGLSAVCGRRRLGRWSELLNRTSRPASLALNVEELKPGAPQRDRPTHHPIHSFSVTMHLRIRSRP